MQLPDFITRQAPAAMAWYQFNGLESIDTPALVVYPDRVRQNIRQAVEIVGDPQRLRPHFKTGKCAAVCSMLMEAGVQKFKCATIAEAELLAMTGAPDVLLAYQPVGPKVDRLLALINQYPATDFSCLVDHIVPAKALAAAASRLALTVGVYVDLNVGMNRTGIAPGAQALELYRTCSHAKGIEPRGLHVYDGHIKDPDLLRRAQACEAAFAPVVEMQSELEAQGFAKPSLVAGGTPTFLIHAQHADRECSPGTFVYWDGGYEAAFPEQSFVPAALVLSRVVSEPDARTLTLDLGHKAIAAENDLMHRMTFLNEPQAAPLSQSEEHLAINVPAGHPYSIGDVFFALPFHICPTVALHEKAYVVTNGAVSDEWPTAARNRTLTV